MFRSIACAILLLSAEIAVAKVVTKSVEYHDGATRLVGYVAYDDSFKEKRPGILVIHEWWGLNDFAKHKAEQLAREGYVALAADMYGEGKVTTDAKVAGELAGNVKGSELIRTRSRAGLDALAKLDEVDSDRLAAIGFCFGGTSVLELAWSGAPVRGVVSFHGGLTTPKPADINNVRASVLVCHGANDDFESPESLQGFQRTMRGTTIDWQMIYYGGAVHSFMNPDSGRLGMKGVGYDERTARRAWQHMLDFFKAILGRPAAP